MTEIFVAAAAVFLVGFIFLTLRSRRRRKKFFDAPFPPENAPEETQRAFLDAFVAALVS